MGNRWQTNSAIKAGLTTLAAQAGVSIINNKGNLKKVFKELGSKDSIKSLTFNIVAAGLTTGIAHGFGTGGDSIFVKYGSLEHNSTLEYFTRKASMGFLHGGISELRGGSFKDGFIGSFGGSYLTEYGPSFGDGSIHAAIYGGLGAELAGGRFSDGALSGFLAWEFNDKFKSSKTSMRLKVIGTTQRGLITVKNLDTGEVRTYATDTLGISKTSGSFGISYDESTGEYDSWEDYEKSLEGWVFHGSASLKRLKSFDFGPVRITTGGNIKIVKDLDPAYGGYGISYNFSPKDWGWGFEYITPDYGYEYRWAERIYLPTSISEAVGDAP